VLAENQTNSNAGFQDTEKAGEEGTHTYVLFPVLSDSSTNPKNNKDALVNGKEHDDIQKSVSPDIYSSSYGGQTKEQGDKAENKDKGKSHVKENQEKDKIGSKPDKNGKRVEAGKSLKQLQLKEEEKPKKTKKEWPKTHTRTLDAIRHNTMEDFFCTIAN
nr:hypothetical protein [Tanacetum cinerariifolium]